MTKAAVESKNREVAKNLVCDDSKRSRIGSLSQGAPTNDERQGHYKPTPREKETDAAIVASRNRSKDDTQLLSPFLDDGRGFSLAPKVAKHHLRPARRDRVDPLSQTEG